jgi:hypothetical protein
MTVTVEVVDVEVTAMEAVTAGVTVPGLAPVVVETDPAAAAVGTDLIHHPASAGALPDLRAVLKPRPSSRAQMKSFLL